MNFKNISILMYHEIGEQDNQWSVSSDEFEKQMQFLKDNDYKTISLDELNERIKENKEIEKHKEVDEKSVVITFDDARKGVFTHAYPLLKNFGFTATIYVVPRWIENSVSNDKNGDSDNAGDNYDIIPNEEKYSEFLTWDELKELSRDGFEIGSHSYSHSNLEKLDEISLMDDLTNADKLIQDKLGINVRHFCYPYGKYNDFVLDVVNDKYNTAVTTNKGFSKLKGKFSRQWILKNTSLNYFKKLLNKPKLSLCMITKNEEHFLEQCLNSVKDLVDEIIIVDTGSTDKTKEIAESFGAKIFDFGWCDDFSAARNESLKHATGDWILVLDADEVLDKKDSVEVEGAINTWDVQGFRILTKNYSNNSSINGWSPCHQNDVLNKSAQGWFPSLKVRLFQNNDEIKFSGKMHEVVDENIQNNNGKISMLTVPVHHYGNLKKNNNHKSEYYLELTKNKIKENPVDAKAYFELGILYKELSKFDLAEDAFKKSLSLDSQQIIPLLNLAIVQQKQNKLDEAISNLNRVLKKVDNADAYFSLGFCYFKKNDLKGSAKNFELAIKYNPRYLDAYINLGGIYEKLERFQEAANFLKRAIELNPKSARSFYNLGVIHEKTMNFIIAIKCYQKAIELNYIGKQELIIKIDELNKLID
jgi:peptidoglycan/xylan/chitin deacetylase (PgdA/CDA1 family)/glycosyltransferase involved in cell wall biosynthesis